MTEDNHTVSDANLSPERDRIREAATRLLAGRPLHSTGALTVVQLAEEAQIKRWRLTHQHPDLMQEFQSAARQTIDESPLVRSWRERNEALQTQVALLRVDNEGLTATVNIYAQVIADLSAALETAHTPTAVTLLRQAPRQNVPGR